MWQSFPVKPQFSQCNHCLTICCFLMISWSILCLPLPCFTPGQVITGSWDKTIMCWDPRGVNGTSHHTLVGTHNQPERVYSLSVSGYNLVVATAGRHVNVYDLRSMSRPEQQRESPLRYQTRCVQCYPNGTGKALLLDSSISSNT